jgi:hypothetical protein
VICSFRPGLSFGDYFLSTKTASRALGFTWDKVGDELRKNRGTTDDGYARLQVWFISAKAAIERGPWYLDFFVRRWFRWAFDGKRPRYKLVFLPDGVTFERNDEPEEKPACVAAQITATASDDTQAVVPALA